MMRASARLVTRRSKARFMGIFPGGQHPLKILHPQAAGGMMVLPRVSFYALMLAAAGIPLYIHLPRFASVNLGVGLGAIGTILLLIRLVDLVQDPVIGWAIDRWPNAQRVFAIAAALGLAIGFPLLFALQPGPRVEVRLVVVLIVLFSGLQPGHDSALRAQRNARQFPDTFRPDDPCRLSRGWHACGSDPGRDCPVSVC